ncbi:hypothetical protein Pcinc_022070 [Petrolisthes cinctipes]|uniref:Uncharacterized protein n=1 Tax=Petrolisthes cinctipes TaxID=88211 RepID=A0AAE1EMI5_PETCI|nr:hypothetical protein Pcinc_036262 [Petrolisthes cinctipes]KAK3872888.1 hypothetical protein Pcinc_022070 [Petrolisthes cinctipes]
MSKERKERRKEGITRERTQSERKAGVSREEGRDHHSRGRKESQGEEKRREEEWKSANLEENVKAARGNGDNKKENEG